MSLISHRNFRSFLIVRTDRLGDVLLTLPLAGALREIFPDATIGMMTAAFTAELVGRHPWIDFVITVDKKSTSELSREIRSHSIDCALLASPTFSLAGILRRAGIPVRVGTGYRWYSFLFSHRRFVHRKSGSKHESEYTVDLLRALGSEPPAMKFPVIPRDPKSEERILNLLPEPAQNSYRLVVVHPGSGGSAWIWPRDSFRILLDRLSVLPDIKVAVTGSPEEVQPNEELLRGNPTVLNLTGKTNLTELSELYRRASVVVAHSTGPLHLAAAAGSPVIGLYPDQPPMWPQRWGPLTEKKIIFMPASETRNLPPSGRMASIRPELIIEAVDLILRNRTEPIASTESMRGV